MQIRANSYPKHGTEIQIAVQGLQTEAFILLLHKLGFLLPADVGKVRPPHTHPLSKKNK